MQQQFQKITLPFIDMVDRLKLPRKLYAHDERKDFVDLIQKDLIRLKFVNFMGTADDLKIKLSQSDQQQEGYYSYTQGGYFGYEYVFFYFATQNNCDVSLKQQIPNYLDLIYPDKDEYGKDQMCGMCIHVKPNYVSPDAPYVIISIAKDIDKNPTYRTSNLLTHRNLIIDCNEPDVGLKQTLSDTIRSEKIRTLVSRLFSEEGKLLQSEYDALSKRLIGGNLDNRDKKKLDLKRLADIVTNNLSDVEPIKTFFDAINLSAESDIDFFEDTRYKQKMVDIDTLLDDHPLAHENALRQLRLSLFVIKSEVIDISLLPFLEARLSDIPLTLESLKKAEKLYIDFEILKKSIQPLKEKQKAIGRIDDALDAFIDQSLITANTLLETPPKDLDHDGILASSKIINKLYNFLEDPRNNKLDPPFDDEVSTNNVLYAIALKTLNVNLKKIHADSPLHITSLGNNIADILRLMQESASLTLPEKIKLLESASAVLESPQKDAIKKLQNLLDQIDTPLKASNPELIARQIEDEKHLKNFANTLQSIIDNDSFYKAGLRLQENVKATLKINDLSEKNRLQLRNLLLLCHELIVKKDSIELSRNWESLVSSISQIKMLVTIDQDFMDGCRQHIYSHQNILALIDKSIVKVKRFQKDSVKSEKVDKCTTTALEILELLRAVDANKSVMIAQLINYLSVVISEPEKTKNNALIDALLSDRSFLAVDHSIHQKMLSLQSSSMSIRFEKSYYELKKYRQTLDRFQFNYKKEYLDRIDYLIAYMSPISLEEETHKLCAYQHLINFITNELIPSISPETNNVERFDFHILLCKSKSLIVDLKKSAKADQDKNQLEEINLLAWHLNHELYKDQKELDRIKQLAEYTDYYKNVHLLSEKIEEFGKQLPALTQQASIIQKKIMSISKHKPRELEFECVKELNDVMKAVILGLNNPKDSENLNTLTNLSQTISGKTSPLWKGLGVAMLVFTGVACILAGVLGAIPTGGIGLLAGISIGLASLAAAETIALGIKAIHYGHEINLAGPVGFFASQLKEMKPKEPALKQQL
jgi:hypothetical protein